MVDSSEGITEFRYAFPDGEMDRWASLGAVTDRSVRLWYRDPTLEPARAVLLVEGKARVDVELRPDPEHDGIATADLVLDAAMPDSAFTVAVASLTREGRFAPAENAPASFRFIFGSCNHPFLSRATTTNLGRNPANAIYRLMSQVIRRKQARFMLFSGDQIYSDGTAHLDVPSFIRDHAAELTDDALLEIYRHLYRGYFHERSYRGLLESSPSYFMWDDHEIFDNWGSRPDPSPADRRIFRAAEAAFREFQHLHNPGTAVGDTVPHSYSFWMGDTGFFVLDLRGERDFEAGQVVGPRQWAQLDAFLDEAASRGVVTVFVVSTIPVIHFAPRMVRLLDRLPGSRGNDVRDRWDSSQFINDRDRLIETLFEWQWKQPRRQAVVLSGDVHAGAAFSVRRKEGGGCLQQWTASALTTPVGFSERLASYAGTRVVNWGETLCHAERIGLETRKNFGLVEVEPAGDGPGHTLSLTLYGYRPRRRSLRARVRTTVRP